MRKILNILTPENVYVEYELAGLGSRFAAVLIDTAIQVLLLCLVAVAALIGGLNFAKIANFTSIVIAVSIIIVFLVVFGYYIFFEMAMKGQSPGKKVMKLKVIKHNGEPINFFDSLLRNILRIGDFLPAMFFLGSMFIVFTNHYKRIGDFAANTIVIKLKNQDKLVTADMLLANIEESETSHLLNIYPVSNNEYSILKEFLSRKDEVGQRKAVFAFHLNQYFSRKFGVEGKYSNPYDFFDDIIRMNSGL